MNAQDLASLLEYPSTWLERNLLLPELVSIQSAQFHSEYGSRRPHGGTEHWRYGAFLFWFKHELNEQILGYLLEAAIADPDPPMAGNILKLIVGHPKCTHSMLQAAIACVGTTRYYYTSRHELEALFSQRSSRTPQGHDERACHKNDSDVSKIVIH
jgi:hypothetical protein